MNPTRLKRLIRPKRGITGYGRSIKPDSWSGGPRAENNLAGEGIASECQSGKAHRLYPAKDLSIKPDAPSLAENTDGCQSGRMEPPAKRLDASPRLEGSNPSPSASTPRASATRAESGTSSARPKAWAWKWGPFVICCALSAVAGFVVEKLT